MADTIQRRMNMTLQDGDLLQGLIIFGGCGGFDGYITWGAYQPKKPKFKKEKK